MRKSKQSLLWSIYSGFVWLQDIILAYRTCKVSSFISRKLWKDVIIHTEEEDEPQKHLNLTERGCSSIRLSQDMQLRYFCSSFLHATGHPLVTKSSACNYFSRGLIWPKGHKERPENTNKLSVCGIMSRILDELIFCSCPKYIWCVPVTVRPSSP
jgi:hypothetical protein